MNKGDIEVNLHTMLRSEIGNTELERKYTYNRETRQIPRNTH